MQLHGRGQVLRIATNLVEHDAEDSALLYPTMTQVSA